MLSRDYKCMEKELLAGFVGIAGGRQKNQPMGRFEHKMGFGTSE